MKSLIDLEQTSVVLNRYPVRHLEATDITIHEYQCHFAQTPQQGDEQRAVSSICYKLGVTAVRLGSRIITREEVSPAKMRSDDWELFKTATRKLDCGNIYERKALESLDRRVLEQGLKKSFNKTEIERASEGGLIWWITGHEGAEKCGDGWEVHRGRRIDVVIDSDGNLYLEIDIHHRFYTPWTLHQWLEEYPDIPISYVRNTYKDRNNNYISWQYKGVSEQLPEQVMLEGLDMSLADYHRNNGATDAEINNSRVVLVKRANDWKAKSVAHLSQRLSPSLTMEMLANIADAESGEESQQIKEVFEFIRKSLDFRIKNSTKTAQIILEKVYSIPHKTEAIRVDGYILPTTKLLAFNDQQVDKVAKVRYKGCARVGETKFGCLNLYNEKCQYPEEVRKFLLEIAKNSRTEIDLDSYRTHQDLPESELDQQIFWQNWSDEGIKTVLVVMPWSPNERKHKIRVQALQAGIATQFIVPMPKADSYKALNVVLGILCKAGWQPIRLEPLDHPECADLITVF